ncbi:MAG: LPS assembly protein LptD [Gammaproteobacteria bacterium]|nr:LPS assembly protein LptD [Gammaproteobacteria bacterium]
MPVLTRIALPGLLAGAMAGNLHAEDLCASHAGFIPERPLLTRETEGEEVLLSADTAVMQEETKTSTFSGDVQLQRTGQVLRANKIKYHQGTNQVNADGDITLWDKRFVISGAQAQLQDEKGSVSQAKYWLLTRRGHGQAKHVDKESDNLIHLKKTGYTTCPPDSEMWRLQSRRISLDFAADRGTARDVTVRIKDIPVFYTPYISFPISDKRQSGLLVPRIGDSSSLGFEFSIPYYWNLAPNYDATITPRLMSKRGLMLQTEFRYLTARTGSQANWEYLYEDNVFDGNRSLFRFQHLNRFSDNLSGGMLYNEVSDRHYFEDFGSALNVVSTTHLERYAFLKYRGLGYHITGRMQSYQTLDTNPNARPYARLPQILFQTTLPKRNKRLNFGLEAEAVYFDQDKTSLDTPFGGRFDLRPGVTFPVRGTAGFIIPKLSFRYTRYKLRHTSEGADETPERGLPSFSTDAGVFLERPLKIKNTALLQTLEPRLFYHYVPYKNQSDLPVFDTSVYDFSYAQMFREDRFSGPDRAGDEHRLSMGLATRFVGRNTGKEYLRAGLGQSVYFRDRRVTLPGKAEKTENSSNIVTEIAGRFGKGLSASHTLQWDPHEQETIQNTMRLRYHPKPKRAINLSYRSRNDLLEQTDISWQWPINSQWSTVGRWNYSLPSARTLETFIGIEYESCCWAFRLITRRYLQNLDGDYQTGWFFQLELKGLAGIGKKTDKFLRENVPGFE